MENEEKGKVIVIIGDWFIDENWLVAMQETYSSSHTGNVHYLSKHKNVDKRMISLCGAPEILVVLKSYFDKIGISNYSFVGFGAWNKDDDNILQCTLCSRHINEKHITPYTIKSLSSVDIKDGIRFCPYVRSSNKECQYRYLNLVNLAKEKGLSTNRIIRCYEGYGGGRPRLLYRFDWQLPITDEHLEYNKFERLGAQEVSAVIIEDHGKGVINEISISELIKVLGVNKATKWYLRTKMDNPKWIKILLDKGIDLRLIVIDYRLAEHWHGQRRWRFGKELGRASLEILGDLTGDIVYEHGEKKQRRNNYKSQRAAVLLDDNTAIAKDGDECFNLYASPGQKQLINIGRTTIFFNALIAQDLNDKYTDKNFGIQCQNALKIAFLWSKQASSAWNKEELHFYGNYDSALEYLASGGSEAEECESTPYSKLWSRWNESSKELGVLEINNEIQLWRGKGILEDYICVGGPKRDAIDDLLAKVSKFSKEDRPKHPFNCLLISSPGWGKSFLSKTMANHFDMYFLEFSISQMANTNDLIDCFDIICSVQNITDKKVLIFMDEINCQIEGHSAMGLLLSPIWDGSFIKGGKMYRLSPAVWIFAATEASNALVQSNKGSDFVSRLNGPIIELDRLATKHGEIVSGPLMELRKKLSVNPNIDLEEDKDYMIFRNMSGVFRTEQVYLGVSLLNNLWGPISKVQKEILQLFHDLLLINGFRSLEFFVSKFENIQRGVVLCSNVPLIDKFQELKRHVGLPKEWSKGTRPADEGNENRLVGIEIEPMTM